MPRKEVKVTEEEYQEIKKENKKKLDEILSIPNYQLYLGRKYFGDRWYTILEDNHYLRKEYVKNTQKYGSTYKNYTSRPIIEMDMDGNVIREWRDAKEWAEETNRTLSAASHVAKCAQGQAMSQKNSAYGSKWKFKVKEENRIDDYEL